MSTEMEGRYKLFEHDTNSILHFTDAPCPVCAGPVSLHDKLPNGTPSVTRAEPLYGGATWTPSEDENDAEQPDTVLHHPVIGWLLCGEKSLPIWAGGVCAYGVTHDAATGVFYRGGEPIAYDTQSPLPVYHMFKDAPSE